MPLTTHLRRRPAVVVVAVAALAAAACAFFAVNRVILLPPHVAPRELTTARATTHVLVDLPRSKLGDPAVSWEYFQGMTTRADLLAHVMDSAPVVRAIARRARIAPDRLAVVAPVTASFESALTEPGSEQRAREILLARRPYRLEVQARPSRPIIDIYAQATSVAGARRLGDAAVAGLRDFLRALASTERIPPTGRVALHQLGPSHPEEVEPGGPGRVAALTFLVVFALVGGILALGLRIRSGARAARPTAAQAPPAPTAAPAPPAAVAAAVPDPVRLRWVPPAAAGAVALPRGGAAFGATLRTLATSGGDWPRTTRVLPWLVAAFLAVLWLVPFDSIQLAIGFPIDLKFDRLVLPLVVVAWFVALAAGGRGAPVLRPTWIHAAVAAFVAVAGLSVVLDAAVLNQSLELQTSLKKVPLLVAYLSLLVVASSTVRRSEVRTFLRYTLLLAVLCAVGVLVEYRTQYNVFFDLAGKLPGRFEVTTVLSGYDFGGRRLTHGPAVHGLVVVAMLAMAMPIALVELLHAERWRSRILYGLAMCLLVGAVLATQRKTAVVAPVAGVLAVAWFRRRELLKLAPVAVALLVGLALVSPGTIAPTLDQFKPSRLGANTVSDRASDYDAIRPDVWTHVMFGRGYGSYQPVGHRILDSEVLVRLVETGSLGLIAFLLLGVAVVGEARRTITSRDPVHAPPALAGAAAAVVFLVVATLFDTMSFPQVPYVFLSYAALVAALVAGGRARSPG